MTGAPEEDNSAAASVSRLLRIYSMTVMPQTSLKREDSVDGLTKKRAAIRPGVSASRRFSSIYSSAPCRSEIVKKPGSFG